MKKFFIFSAVYLFFSFVFIFAGDLESRVDEYKKSMGKIGETIKLTSGEISKIEKELKAIVARGSQLNEFIKNLDNEINLFNKKTENAVLKVMEFENQIFLLEDEIRNKNQSLYRFQDSLGGRLRSFYKAGGVKYSYIKILFDSKNIWDFLIKLRYMKEILNHDINLIRNLREERYELEEKKDAHQRKKNSLQIVVNNLKKDLEKIVEFKTKKQHAFKIIQSDEKLNKERLSELRSSQRLMQNKIREITAQIKQTQEAIKAAKLAFEKKINKLPWPVKSRNVIRNFGWYHSDEYSTRIKSNGIAIKINDGDEVYSVDKGTAVFAGLLENYGNTIIINHGGGYSTVYCHLKKITVNTGENVTAGQIIANGGSSGSARQPMLYFEVHSVESPVDPLIYLITK